MLIKPALCSAMLAIILLIALTQGLPVSAGTSGGNGNSSSPNQVLVSLASGADAYAIAQSVSAQVVGITLQGVWVHKVAPGTADQVAAILRTHVSGLAGLIWASGKCSTASCVRSRIENNADAISKTGKHRAKGRINVYKSLNAP